MPEIKENRLMKALRIEIPDRVPICDFIFSKKLFRDILNIEPKPNDSLESLRLAIKLGLDGIYCIPLPNAKYKKEYKDKNIYVDEFGVYFKEAPGVWSIDFPFKYPLNKYEDLKHYTMPDPEEESRYSSMQQASKMSNSEVALIGTVMGPFSMAYILMGMENISFCIHDNPVFFEEVLEISNEFFIKMALKMIKTGINVICVCEDLGFNNGLLVSPIILKKYVIPRLKILVDKIKEQNIPVMFHSDGDINEILGDIVDMGINGLHPLERTANMSLQKVKNLYGDRICIFGNIDSKNILSTPDKDLLISEVLECIKIAAPGGGYVLASDHSITDSVPSENFITIIETVKKYGRYPTEI